MGVFDEKGRFQKKGMGGCCTSLERGFFPLERKKKTPGSEGKEKSQWPNGGLRGNFLDTEIPTGGGLMGIVPKKGGTPWLKFWKDSLVLVGDF